MEKIAIIYTEAQGVSENLRSLSIPQGMEAQYIPLPAKESGHLLAAYQSAMTSSDARYKIYVNGSVRILDSEILGRIVRVFQSHPDIGILGLSGARELSTSGVSYLSQKRAGRLVKPDGKELVFSKQETSAPPYETVEALDGCFLATQHDVPWRSDLLHGPLYLGASASCEHRRAGFEAAVLAQEKAACQLVDNHFSSDDDDKDAFLDEYSGELYPLVSICIPTYQRPEYFRQALESVLHQTYRNLDIFITDDSPDDETERLIAGYASDSRISYYHHPEYGMRENWSELFAYDNPKAEYVGWLMDDDMFLSEKIATMVEAYRNHPNVSLVTSYRHLIDKDGKQLPDYEVTKPMSQEDVIFSGAYIGKTMLMSLGNQIGEPSTTLMCKKYIRDQQYRWTEIDFAYDIVDVPIWLNMLSQGDLYYCAEPLSCFRIHGDNSQDKISTMVGGTICWATMVGKAWREKCFLETEEEYQMALRSLLRMGLPLCERKAFSSISWKERADFERVLGRAFSDLSEMSEMLAAKQGAAAVMRDS